MSGANTSGSLRCRRQASKASWMACRLDSSRRSPRPLTHASSTARVAASVGVTDHVDDDAVRVADEEAPWTPRLFGQRVDDLVATPAGLCVGRIDVVDVHADRRVLGCGGIAGDEADLDRAVLGR